MLFWKSSDKKVSKSEGYPVYQKHHDIESFVIQKPDSNLQTPNYSQFESMKELPMIGKDSSNFPSVKLIVQCFKTITNLPYRKGKPHNCSNRIQLSWGCVTYSQGRRSFHFVRLLFLSLSTLLNTVQSVKVDKDGCLLVCETSRNWLVGWKVSTEKVETSRRKKVDKDGFSWICETSRNWLVGWNVLTESVETIRRKKVGKKWFLRICQTCRNWLVGWNVSTDFDCELALTG